MAEGIIQGMMGRLARSHYERGRCYELQDRVAEAVRAYRRAAELEPGWAEPHFALGRLEAQAGRYASALTALERAAALDADPEIVEWRAYVLGRLRRYEEALDAYLSILDEGPPVVRVNAGRMLLALGRYDEAERLLRESNEPCAAMLLDALPRYREFRPGERTDEPRALRYLFGGTVVLGTLGDGGVALSGSTYLLLSPRHVAVTVGRLRRLAALRGWHFDGVAGEGAHHGPVARLVAEVLGVPLVDEPRRGRRVLLASAVVDGLETARRLRAPWEAAGARVLDFALGLSNVEMPSPEEPALVGFVGCCAVPWFRVERRSRLVPDPTVTGGEFPGFRVGEPFVNPNSKCVDAELREALRRDLEDPFARAVLAWYVERHGQARALRWEGGRRREDRA